MFAHRHRAVSLVFTQTFVPQWTIVTLGGEFKTKAHFASRLLHQAAALGVDLSSRTDRRAFLHVDLKIFHAEAALFVRAGLSRANNLPAFGLRLHQLFRRYVDRK